MKNEYNIDLFWRSREETVIQRSFQKNSGKAEFVRAVSAYRPRRLLIIVSRQILRFNLVHPVFKSVLFGLNLENSAFLTLKIIWVSLSLSLSLYISLMF